jgi:hypothetical protein
MKTQNVDDTNVVDWFFDEYTATYDPFEKAHSCKLKKKKLKINKIEIQSFNEDDDFWNKK